MRRYVMKAVGPGVFLPPFLQILQSRADVHEKYKYGKLMGAWYGEIGNVNTGKSLKKYVLNSLMDICDSGNTDLSMTSISRCQLGS